MSTEWGIRYVDPDQVSMSGPVVVTIPVQDEATARTATGWTHAQWKNRDVKVVHREVTEWQEDER